VPGPIEASSSTPDLLKRAGQLSALEEHLAPWAAFPGGASFSFAARRVAHHVSAILRKLAVSSRGQAAAEAVRHGLAGKDG
jgi:hypothetical protein